VVRRANVVPPLPSNHSPATIELLASEGLPADTPLGITSQGRVRHIIMWERPGVDSTKNTLCCLFRPGVSFLRVAGVADEEPICGACLRTLEAEVMRAKEAMRGEVDGV
jgi:hypothetical protein